VADAREPAGRNAGVRMADAHSAAVNCVRWHPGDERTLLSAASEPAARLWDLRSPGRPLHELVGHVCGRRIPRRGPALAPPGSARPAYFQTPAPLRMRRRLPCISTSPSPHRHTAPCMRASIEPQPSCLRARAATQIYQPQFVGDGAWVATGGQGSRALWLYSCATGGLVSRGDIGFDPAAALAGPGRGGALAAATARAIVLFAPVFST
jgi:hypothetical protein